MIGADDIWPFKEHSAKELCNLSCMSASVEDTQEDFFPAHINHGTCMPIGNIPSPVHEAAARSKLNLHEANGTFGLSSLPPVYFQNLLPTPNLNVKGKSWCASFGLSGRPGSNIIPSSSGKKYLIFDQSGNDTRMLFKSVCSPFLYPSTAAMRNVNGCGLDKIDRFDSIEPLLRVEYDENHVSGNGSDMHEDTDEINALLYSDDDEDHEEDDEVLSTGHSPNVYKRTSEKLELFEYNEEVCSCPKKMQKVFHGQDDKLKALHDYHSDAESNIQEENINSSADNEPSKTTKICETLRILECIVPGTKGKDSMLIIDESIDYLKSLKHRALALGMHYH